ncbi:hypothetical protein ACLK17_23515 [Escherichia coli]
MHKPPRCSACRWAASPGWTGLFCHFGNLGQENFDAAEKVHVKRYVGCR